METDGEGGGGEAGRRGRSELRRLLEAIESSEVVEKRIPLIKQLEGSSPFSADDLGLILQCLLASWTDSACSGVPHCTLHKSVLQVALKCSDLDITDYLRQFLNLGAKANSWCGKHLQWSIKSIDESQVVQEEEHDRLCLEINSLSFVLSTKLFGIAAKCFTELGLEVAPGGAGQEECVLNKADDAFPTFETMAVEVDPEPAHLAVGATPWSLAPGLSPPTRKASRRCMYCGSEKTPRWLRGPDGPGTLCNACGLRLRRLLHSNPRRCQGHPSKNSRPSKENGNDVAVLVEENSHDMAMTSWNLAPLPQEASRRCAHCASEKTPRWRWGPNGPNTLCNACGLRFNQGRLLDSYSTPRRSHPSKKHRPSKENGDEVLVEGPSEENGHDMSMAPWSLAPLPQETSRRCTDYALEKMPRWPNGPGTLCNACGQGFKEGRLLQSNSRCRRGRHSSCMENLAAGNDLVAALGEPLSCGVGTSLDAFFDQMGLEVSSEEAGPERAEEEEEELEWLSNKDAFPSVETMELEVEEASALDALPAAARTKGRQRVTAMETCRQANVPPAEKETVVSPMLPRRQCTHCATEETPAWRVGPEGPYTLCNPCGIVFMKKGRLLPEYRPANSPAFSPQLHSNKYSRALEMHRRNETSATGEVRSKLVDGPANGPTSSSLQRYSSLCRVLEERCQSEEKTSAAGRASTEAGHGEMRLESMEVLLLPERPPPYSPAFSMLPHRHVLKRRRQSEEETFAGIRATAKALRDERAAARLAALDN